MLIDGGAIAREMLREIQNRVSHRSVAPHLTVCTCTPNFETRMFLALKKRKAAEVGITVNVLEFPEDVATEEVIQSIDRAQMQTDGIVVQLPFPKSIEIERVLARVPEALDVDVLHYDGANTDGVLPPVVGAIAEITERHNVVFAKKRVVVVGNGQLVGRPAALWASAKGAEVSVVTKESENITEAVKGADILILGAGQANLITPDMVKEGVVIFDAGTSESAGALVGDADPACARVAYLMTPVPNGIGPITVAVLLRNLLLLSRKG